MHGEPHRHRPSADRDCLFMHGLRCDDHERNLVDVGTQTVRNLRCEVGEAHIVDARTYMPDARKPLQVCGLAQLCEEGLQALASNFPGPIGVHEACLCKLDCIASGREQQDVSLGEFPGDGENVRILFGSRALAASKKGDSPDSPFDQVVDQVLERILRVLLRKERSDLLHAEPCHHGCGRKAGKVPDLASVLERLCRKQENPPSRLPGAVGSELDMRVAHESVNLLGRDHPRVNALAEHSE